MSDTNWVHNLRMFFGEAHLNAILQAWLPLPDFPEMNPLVTWPLFPIYLDDTTRPWKGLIQCAVQIP